jgi:hypothetical protein
MDLGTRRVRREAVGGSSNRSQCGRKLHAHPVSRGVSVRQKILPQQPGTARKIKPLREQVVREAAVQSKIPVLHQSLEPYQREFWNSTLPKAFSSLARLS